MCPKCKSRKRYRLGKLISMLPRRHNVIRFLPKGGIKFISPLEKMSFYCSDCGYEIGRWG